MDLLVALSGNGAHLRPTLPPRALFLSAINDAMVGAAFIAALCSGVRLFLIILSMSYGCSLLCGAAQRGRELNAPWKKGWGKNDRRFFQGRGMKLCAQTRPISPLSRTVPEPAQWKRLWQGGREIAAMSRDIPFLSNPDSC